MKNLLTTIALILTVTFGFSQEASKGQDITVTIENIKNNKGHVLLSLHNSDTFMKGKGLMNLKSEIKDGKIVVTFEDVTPGEYAIMALHDENDNERMDFESNGMPKEDYAMSNNVMSFGPPRYADAKFKLENKDLDLKLKF